TSEDLAKINRRQLDRKLAARNAIDVEQFIQQSCQLSALAVDGLAHRLECRIVESLASHEIDGVADRGKRIAQLMREHRDEFLHALRRIGQSLGMPSLREGLGN